MFFYSKYCSQLLNGNDDAYLPELLGKLNETITALLSEMLGDWFLYQSLLTCD